MAEGGEIKTWSPTKGISEEIILEILIRHRDSMKQARTGELVEKSVEDLRDNERRFNQVRGLNLVISAQKEMITQSRAQIYNPNKNKWNKDFKTDIEKQDNPFLENLDNLETIKYDYNKLLYWLGFLRFCAKQLKTAERTSTKEDDFIIINIIDGIEMYELTDNFEEMLEDLEESYEHIYLLMMVYKIVSAGIDEDEDKTNEEKEEEAIRRIRDA